MHKEWQNPEAWKFTDDAQAIIDRVELVRRNRKRIKVIEAERTRIAAELTAKITDAMEENVTAIAEIKVLKPVFREYIEVPTGDVNFETAKRLSVIYTDVANDAVNHLAEINDALNFEEDE